MKSGAIKTATLAGRSTGAVAGQVAGFLFPFLLVGSLWEIAVRSGLVDPKILPAPSAIFDRLMLLAVQQQALQHHILASLQRLAIGYVLALAVGILAGLAIGISRRVRDAFTPLLSLLIAVPTIAWVPLLLIVVGLGDRTVVTAVFLGGVFEITYAMAAGIRSVDVHLIYAAQIMGVKPFRLFLSVLLPGALVHVMPVLRLCIGYCWRALVGGEMLSAMIDWGVGKMIYEARFWNDVGVMFVGLATIGLLGFLMDRLLLQTLEARTIQRWGLIKAR